MSPKSFQPPSSSPLAAPTKGRPRPDMHLRPIAPSPILGTSHTQESESEDERLDNNGIPSILMNRLRTFPLFKDAPKLFHSKVASKLKLFQYHPQAYIIKEGDPSLSMFWILKGSVSVTSTDGESVYAELNTGSFFGEIGILYNRPRTATVVANQRVLAGVLTADSLNGVLRSYPVIERRIRDEAQERLAMQEKKNKADIPILKVSKTPAVGAQELSLRPIVSSIISSSTSPLPLSQIVHATQSSRVSVTLADNVDQTISIQAFIKSVPIFSNLPQNIIHKLALGVEPISLKSFEYILRKGHTGLDIYFITDGEVEVVDYVNNREVVLARLKDGSYFGEMSFLKLLQGKSNMTRSAAIRSVSSVELIVIRSDLLEQVCLQYPKIVEEMRRTASARQDLNNGSSLQTSRIGETLTSFPTPSSTSNIGLPLNDFNVFKSVNSAAETHQSNLFNSSWSFDTDPVKRYRESLSRSVSPVSGASNDSTSSQPQSLSTARTTNSGNDGILGSRKRFSTSESQKPLPRGPLDLAVPPMNPTSPGGLFQANLSRNNSFQYMPVSKRIKLSSLAGRRRSSVLVPSGSIPSTILLRSFEYLSLADLMKLRLVCRRWRQLLYAAPNLFNVLDLTPWNTRITDTALVHITDFVGSRPVEVNISNCFHVTDEGFSYLVNEIGMSGKIQVFKMSSLWEVSAMAIMDLTSPSVGQHLQEVNLSNCRKVTDNVVERLIGWKSKGESSLLHLPGSEGIYNLEAGSRNLKVLNLSYCKYLTDSIMYHIAFHANDTLESLNLTRCTTITDLGFLYWTYKSFPNLKKLSIKDCTFLSDKAIISLANAAPNLEILNLNFCCALLDVAIEVLCLGCPNLRELDLSFCGSAVSDSSLVTLSLNLTKLEKLIIRGCVRVTRAGVDAILSAYMPLRFLDISQCRNAHLYPGGIAAQELQINPDTKSAFITAGNAQKIIEISF